MSIRYDTGNKNEDRAFCDQGLKDVVMVRGGFSGEERGSEEPDSLWVIVLAWLQLVTSSLEASTLK